MASEAEENVLRKTMLETGVRSRFFVGLLAIAALIVVVPASSALAADLWVSPSGSSSSCTAVNPCALATSNTVATAGSVVWLAPGDYGALGTRISFTKANVRWTADPAKPLPRLLGEVVATSTATNSRLDHVDLAGRTGDVNGNVTSACGVEESGKFWIDGASGFRLDHNKIHGAVGYFGVFVYRPVTGVRIDHNHIYDIGCFQDAAATGNLSHGIYWHNGTGRIEDNLIEHNHAFGVQLFPGPDGVTVTNNTIVNNGRAGILLGGAVGSRITNNIVANNAWGGHNNGAIQCYQGGSNNQAINNIFWNNPGGTVVVQNSCQITSSGNLTANPLFGATYRIGANSPAVGFASLTYATATDFDDQPRDASPDAGFDEYVGP